MEKLWPNRSIRLKPISKFSNSLATGTDPPTHIEQLVRSIFIGRVHNATINGYGDSKEGKFQEKTIILKDSKYVWCTYVRPLVCSKTIC